MNLFSNQKTLWTGVLGALLTVGLVAPAGARDHQHKSDHKEASKGKKGESHENAREEGELRRQQPEPWNNGKHRQALEPQSHRGDDGERASRQRNEDEHDKQRQQEALRGEVPRATVQHPDSLRDTHRYQQARQQAERRNDVQRPDHRQQQQRGVSRELQERRINDERQRADRYRSQLARQQQAAEQRARVLQQQRRTAQYLYQQQYYQRLRQQQARWNAGGYNPSNDRYFSTPASYRYSYNGSYRETNRYGADLLRQAVNYGYQEGLRAGRADLQDGWRSDYRSSYGYQDANYGYNGQYIAQDQYNHYFREGFERGYGDGHSNSFRYGQSGNGGNANILASVLSMILGLQGLN